MYLYQAPSFRILMPMRRMLVLLVSIAATLPALAARSGIEGMFRGILLDSDAKPGWAYVQGRNNSLRLVRIDGAQVYYAESVPPAKRDPKPVHSLRPGADIRVTAEEDGHGNWRAKEIEIIHLPQSPAHRHQLPSGVATARKSGT
jgi:hypothetical protein